MSWMQDLFPTWKDKLTMIFLTLLITICLVFVISLPKEPSTPVDVGGKEGSSIRRWEDGDVVCFILTDEISKKPITMSCLLNK
jgi:hypothetical protein